MIGTRPAAVADAPLFEVVCRTRGRSVIVEVSGELDLWSAPQLAAHLRAAIVAAAPHARVLVDCRRVGFLGCSGLAALAEAADHSRLRGVDLRVSASGHAVRRALSWIPVHLVPDREESRW